MNLDFDADRWARVRDAYRRWWAGELGRPLINLTLRGRDPGRPEPRLPSHEFTSLYDLDALLEIEALKGVQWVPGAGQPGVTRWPEIYRKIRAAGKRIQFFTNQDERGIDSLDILADQLGGAEGIIMIGEVANEDEPRVRDLLKRYDVEDSVSEACEMQQEDRGSVPLGSSFRTNPFPRPADSAPGSSPIVSNMP